jgi:predicted MFS family arabinose efflux permease
MGRNEAFNHAGNVSAALLAGWVGDHIAHEGIFYLVAVMAAGTILATWLIRGKDIDYARARGAVEASGQPVSAARLRSLIEDRRIVNFILAVSLFHFANAAMLPLVGQKLTDGKHDDVATDMSACIIAAQLVMIPVSIAASRFADSWGRKPVFLIGFAALPIRGILYALSTNPYYLVSVQLLDGVGAGIFGVVGVLTVADLTRGTGRFNLMQGVLATAVGIGASLSNLLTGFIVYAAGYNAGFLALSAIAAAAAAFYTVAVPETGNRSLQASSPNRAPGELGTVETT